MAGETLPKLKMFQYWDTEDLPSEVAAWTQTLKEQNPEYDHRLYRRGDAAEYIGAKLGDRERSAFLTCAVPAGQADYFRLCAMVAEGGLYLDADSQPLKPLATLLDDIPHAFLYTYAQALTNAIMMFRGPGNLFLIDCLKLATDNIEHRRFDTVFSSVGPNVLNAVHAVIDAEGRAAVLDAQDTAEGRRLGFPELLAVADRIIQPAPEKLLAFRQITTFHAFRTLPWIGAEQPAYKSTGRHWSNWEGSIYF